MSLRVLGIGPGDEVITSAYSYTASASPVVHVGATLVLVDTKKIHLKWITMQWLVLLPKNKSYYPCRYCRGTL